MKISTYKLLGQYRIASTKTIDNVYRLSCFCEYYDLQIKPPFIKKVKKWKWVAIKYTYKSLAKNEYVSFSSVSEVEQAIAQLEEKRLCNELELGEWKIIKSIGNELMGAKITYDKETDHGYIYLIEKQIPIKTFVSSDDNLFVLDFDKNDQLIGIEFRSLKGLIKFIESNISLSISQEMK